MDQVQTTKQRIIEMLERLPDDIDFDRAIEGICVLRRIDAGIVQSERGEGIEHETFMQELLGDHAEAAHHLDAAG